MGDFTAMRTKHTLFVLLSALCLVTVWAQPFDADIRQTADYKQAQTWVPVLLRDNAATSRTNLGLGATWLTNTNVTNFRSAISLGATNSNVKFNSLILGGENNFILNTTNWFGPYEFFAPAAKFYAFEVDGFVLTTTNDNLTLYSALYFGNTTNAAITRTNLGLGSGITTNRTFVANGVTNSVSISNGIITGWTQ
jgi:hypothetical protein